MNTKKLKDIERRSYDPTMPHKDFPPHYHRHRPYRPGIRRTLSAD